MNYKELKVAELRKVAEERGILNVSSMKKTELVEMLEGIDEMKKARQQAAQASDQEKKAKTAKTEKPEVKKETKNETKKAEKKNAKEKASKDSSAKEGSVKEGSVKEGSVKEGSVKDSSAKKGSAKPKAAKASLQKTAKKTASKKTADKNAEAQQNAENKTAENKTVEKKTSENRDKQTKAAANNQEVKQTEFDPNASVVSTAPGTNEALKDAPIEEENVPQNEVAEGILEVLQEGYGFIRSDNYMPGEKDIYVSPSQIRKFRLRTGDIVKGPVRRKTAPTEKFNALLYIDSVNGYKPDEIVKRMKFEDMTPIFPNERIKLDFPGAPLSLRIVDLFSPIGKGQRGMIVSPPKAGKTTLLKQIAKRISRAYPEMNVLVLLIDERPEEVTDIKESIEGPNAEVIYSTFDELPEHHKRVSEMAIERAKRLVESGEDVVILIDSITRLSRAYNLTITPSGRTLSGGLDPAALHMPKKFFGAARNMREGGSLTILATALIETGSRLDDVVFEEFKGTGNMELVLDRDLQEKRVFPAIDVSKSGTRKDNLLLNPEEREVLDIIHRRFHSMKPEEVTEDLLKIFAKTKDNAQFVGVAKKLFANN